jgi:hypothetical protein
MKKSFTTYVAICAAVAIFGYLFWPMFFPQPVPQVPETTRVISVEEYVKSNISSLSPVKETMGGTFYVTHIDAHGGIGTVSYEDGHNMYIADFRYTVDENGSVKIATFNLQ